MLKKYNMKKLIKWFAGFFEDQAGTASSKRAVLFICLFELHGIVKHVLAGYKIADAQILYWIVGIILFCIGAVTSEFFKKDLNGDSKENKEIQ